MEHTKTVYIALGSNKGDKLQHLQAAVNLIFKTVGTPKKLSKIYKTEALGFNGDPFYNACIKVETTLNPKKLLKQLQRIETLLGRAKKTKAHYEAREIDLDILFYDAVIYNEKKLVIPHPELHKRKFVLHPLQDVAKDDVLPGFNKTSAELLRQCEDDSEIETLNIWLKNPLKNYSFKAYNYIAIEGNIGAGKTSLVHKIANDFNAKRILERFADNPFLPKFYKDKARYAFTLEMSFLADRYQQISDDLAQLDLFKDFIISDYDINKSLIFSKVTLLEDEFRLYRTLFHQVYKDIATPDLYVYLYQNPERLQANIKKRGRNYEKNIETNYLEKINTGYLEFLKSQTEMTVKIIDITERDFVKNREDYLWLLYEIEN